MSEIIVTIDSKEKTMEVKVDGKKLKNVTSVSAYQYSEPENLYLSISTCEKCEDSGLHTYNTISLAEEGKLTREEVKAESHEISIAKVNIVKKLDKDISKIIASEIKSKMKSYKGK